MSDGRRPGLAALSVRRRALLASAAAILAAAAALPAASASPRLQLGVFDDAQTLQHPAAAFATLKKLRAQVVRITLDWRQVAPTRPKSPGDPLDPAYRWAAYDTAVQAAAHDGIEPLLTIWGTPAWANGGKAPNYAPTQMRSLYYFAFAAASRYSGTFYRRNGRPLAQVRLWLAWNEPNNPLDLSPQYTRTNGKWTLTSPATYAKICTAVYQGIHNAEDGVKVGCGATAPRGDDSPESPHPSVSPLAFLRGVKAAGLRQFDAWAHQPYYASRNETPTTSPPAGEHRVELGNIDVLIAELTHLYGPRRVWITEYGFETNPPDRLYGVTWAQQARYLREAYLIAKANPRIDLFTWSPLRDDANVAGGRQSGLETVGGIAKPAFDVFAQLRD